MNVVIVGKDDLLLSLCKIEALIRYLLYCCLEALDLLQSIFLLVGSLGRWRFHCIGKLLLLFEHILKERLAKDQCNMNYMVLKEDVIDALAMVDEKG